MTLKVTPNEVRSKAQQIETQKQAMDQLMQAMTQEIQRLPSEFWASQSGMNFAERFRSVQQNCQGALNRLITHIDNLRKAADTYDRVEGDQGKAIGALGTQNIFPS